MSLSVKELETRKCTETNKNLFEDVAKGYVNAKDVYRVQYTILNYEKIIDQMIEYLDGYVRYSESDDKKYDGKVLAVSRSFFDKMFTEKEYRMKINLEQFKDINKTYLKKTKELQTVIESYLNDKEISAEMESLIRMTNNQYKKLAKVCRDDMKIWLWLTTSNSKRFAYHLDDTTRSAYNDKRSPVMHKHVPK